MLDCSVLQEMALSTRGNSVHARIDEIELQAEALFHAAKETVRSAIEIIGCDDAIARLQRQQQRMNGRHARREGEATGAAFQVGEICQSDSWAAAAFPCGSSESSAWPF